MQEKPAINQLSSAITESKYRDPETGLKLTSAAKVQVFGQELIKNRKEVIEQIRSVLDVSDGLSFRPEINKTSKGMKRSVKSLLDW